MAVLKTILHKKNSSGNYDDVYVRTRADNVLMTDNSTLLSAKISAMDTTISGKAASSHNHAASNITSGTLGVARGGTGKSSWTANRLVYPSASTTMTQLAFPSVAGSVLRQGTSGAPYWTSINDLKTSLGVSSETVLYDSTFSYTTADAVTLTLSDYFTNYKTIEFHFNAGNYDIKRPSNYYLIVTIPSYSGVYANNAKFNCYPSSNTLGEDDEDNTVSNLAPGTLYIRLTNIQGTTCYVYESWYCYYSEYNSTYYNGSSLSSGYIINLKNINTFIVDPYSSGETFSTAIKVIGKK